MDRRCAACGEAPARGIGQTYCRTCATAKDKASARARRAELSRLRKAQSEAGTAQHQRELELKALREEIKALRARIKG